MDATVTQLIFRESGGFTGLQRGCTIEPGALPDAPRSELEGLIERPGEPGQLASAANPASASMPDMQIYTLELVMHHRAEMQSEHRVLQYPASDVPTDVSALIDFLREHARPL